MPKFANRTGRPSHVSGIYRSVCHSAERTILEGQKFPRCGYCNSDASWVLVKAIKPGEQASSKAV